MAKINGKVTYSDDKSPYYGGVYLLKNGSIYDTEKTDREGKFTFQNVADGKYIPGSSKNRIIQPTEISMNGRDITCYFIMIREPLSRKKKEYIYVPVAVAIILAGIDSALFNDWVTRTSSIDEIIARLRKAIYKKAQHFDVDEDILRDGLKHVLTNPMSFNLNVYLEKMQESERLITEEKHEESGVVLEELANNQIELLNKTENGDDRRILSALVQDILYRASCSYHVAGLSDTADHIYEKSLDYY